MVNQPSQAPVVFSEILARFLAHRCDETMTLPRSSVPKLLINGGLFVLLIALVSSIPLVYVSRERFFYAWDFRGYQLSSINQVHNLIQSPLAPLRVALDSLGDDYNALFTVPLAPLMLLLGKYESRAVYILSLALIYFLAFACLVGLIFANLVRQRRLAAFWVGTLITILLPAAWIPTLRGYPDTGGAVAIALAILVYIKDPRLKHWWQILIIGLSLAVGTLFRRHFGYAVTAFMISIILMAGLRFMADFKRNRKDAFQGLISDGLRIGSLGLAAILSLLIIGYPFVTHVFSQNFLQLYSSFETSLVIVVNYFGAYYGWLALLLAFTGLALGVYKQVLKTEASLFITLLALVSFAQWGLIVRQVNPHYTLHFTFIILLGISAGIWLIFFSLKGYWRTAGIAILAVYLLINGLAWFGAPRISTHPIIKALLPGEVQPLRRSDYTEISRLVKYLRSKSSADQSIYVIDSSTVLNADLLSSADQILYPHRTRLNILQPPQVDSRDFYPLDVLLEADLVVISRPLQRHLPLEEQGVVSSVYDLFIKQAEIAHDFTRLPVEFHLMDGVETSVYIRKQETPIEVALRTMQYIQGTVGNRPGSQLDWMALDNSTTIAIQPAGEGHRLIGTIDQGTDQPTLSFLYLGRIPENGIIRGNLALSTGCPDVQMIILLANGEGGYKQLTERKLYPGVDNPFVEALTSPGWPYLVLEFSPASQVPEVIICQVVTDIQLSGK